MDQDEQTVYSAVAVRRMQWDNLVWQVPLISLTAQAFLFSIALAPDTTQLARTVAAALALVVTTLCIVLMARHRQAEITDAHWLERRERKLPKRLRVHGRPWRVRRDLEDPSEGFLTRRVPIWPGYRTWIVGLAIFGCAAVGIIVVTWSWPAMLTGPPP